MLGALALVMIARLDERHEPVPMQHGHVVVQIGRGVPAQEVIMVDADFAGRVMVADVVVVGLGQRDVNDAENQNADSQDSNASSIGPLHNRHDLASPSSELETRRAAAGNTPFTASENPYYGFIMSPVQPLVKPRRGREPKCV